MTKKQHDTACVVYINIQCKYTRTKVKLQTKLTLVCMPDSEAFFEFGSVKLKKTEE